MVIDTTKLDHDDRTHHRSLPQDPQCAQHFREQTRHEIKWIWETHFTTPSRKGTKFLSEAVEHTRSWCSATTAKTRPASGLPHPGDFKRESDGIVLMDFHRCIGCRFCMAACPFGARSFNFRDPRPFIEETNKNFPPAPRAWLKNATSARNAWPSVKMPACVEASDGAIAFGDLEDPQSEIRELLRENYTIRRKQVSLGTGPSVYYIV
jgi:Fe-S-cluster-containing dehydrogenase component